jgi:hypothetical protein
MELAAKKNAQPLPLIREKTGLRLPPERHCLLSLNYQLLPLKTTDPMPTETILSNIQTHSALRSLSPFDATPSPSGRQQVPQILQISHGSLPSNALPDEDDDYDMEE